MRYPPSSPGLWLVVLMALAVPTQAPADDFCVETDLYVGGQPEPALRTRTLFSVGVVYDFLLGGSEEITIFDPKRGRFVLLDRARKVQTALTNEDILQFTAAIQAASQEKGGEVFYQREWSLAFDESSGWLTLSGERLMYRARGAPPELASAARQFREFADWYARLNAMRSGNIPPFARLELNKALLNRGLIPTEIERTVTSDSLPKRKHMVRSQHLVHWRLSNTDHKRIQEAAQLRATFPEIPFVEYRQPLASQQQ